MSETIVVLPGWGLNPAALEPFAKALRALRPQASVQIEPLPTGRDPQNAIDALDAQVPAGAWLIGWSLGGMLATALAGRRGIGCPGVVTFASNASFVASETWPSAMDSSTFTAFAGRCAADPGGTLKRFGLLCVQGSPAGRALIKPLTLDAGHAQADGLALLSALDNRDTLAAITQPQLHLFATQDALVPVQAAEALGRLAPGARVEQVAGSHAFVLEAPDALAECASAFIEDFTHG